MWHIPSPCRALVYLLACPSLTFACGIERTLVKNAADAQAADAIASPLKLIAVTDMAAMVPRPKSILLKYEEKRFPEEMFHVRTVGLLIGYKLEADGDYHAVIADPEYPHMTMVVEIPSPDCITIDLKKEMTELRAFFDQRFGRPTAKYKTVSKKTTVFIEGVLFRDFFHGQTGAAKSGTEIHPVLRMEAEGIAAALAWSR